MENVQKSWKVNQRKVVLRDAFWSKYEKLIREVAIPYQWSTLNDEDSSAEPSHAIRNFRIAAGLEKGGFYGFVFQDSDVYKWLEGVSYSLEKRPDRELEELTDRTALFWAPCRPRVSSRLQARRWNSSTLIPQ
jgi:uncharacterized protein